MVRNPPTSLKHKIFPSNIKNNEIILFYRMKRGIDNLTSSDQIMAKLEAVEKEDFPEVNNKDKVNVKEKKNKHKTKENF